MMSDQHYPNLIEHGRQIRDSGLWDGAWRVDGRPITNEEMHALVALHQYEGGPTLGELDGSLEECCEIKT